MSEIENCIVLMKRHKIKQKDVAEESGYTKDWVSMILNEKAHSPDALLKIRKAIDRIIQRKEKSKTVC